MLDEAIRAEYDATRATPHTDIFCHAPFTSVNFEQNGNATVCCYNRAQVLGTYPADSIDDMWHGPKAHYLRQAMRENSLPAGCQICHDQFKSRNFGGLRARFYDQLAEATYPVRDGRLVPMPKVFEFEISNVCNLGCTMCTGFFSSTIRKHREHRPPLKSPYDREFVRQLEPFIPHLREARFLGGEPFLIKHYYRIWDLIARLNPDLKVTIVTNGTILSDRVREAIEPLNAHINISIDALDRENYERIRVNAVYDEMMTNVEWFKDYVDRHKTSMTFNVCPMQQNWHELPHFLEHCNRRGILLFFNTVIFPEDASLRNLTSAELAEVVECLEATSLPDGTDVERWNCHNFVDLIHQIRSFQASALDDYDVGRFAPERLDHTEWAFRVDGDNEADFAVPSGDPDGARVNITSSSMKVPWDIQLNRTTFPIRTDHRYVVRFRARADRLRPMMVGVARARDPWDNLGLYTNVSVTPDWQDYEMGFGPPQDAGDARIHFDLGDSDAGVEVSHVELLSRPIPGS